MAQRVHVVLEDDLDGGDAAETVLFGIDGVSYEIDLSERNASRLREALAGYIAAGRRTTQRGRRSGRRSSGGSGGSGPTTQQIRDWARSNGYEVSGRGRISADVRAAYDAAH